MVLQDLNDNDLIQKVKTQADSDALMELVDRHSGIYLSMISKYAMPNTARISREDLIDEKDSYIYEAVMGFDPDRGAKFSTYLGNSTKWRCLNTCKKNSKRSFSNIDEMNDDNYRCLSESDPKFTPELVVESGIISMTRNEILEKVLTEVDNHPDDRIRTIFSKRYILKEGSSCLTPWKNIADELSLSIQGVIDIHNRFLKQIKKQYEL